MKKIVALLMVLAIVAGAFAADISAALNTGFLPVSGDNDGVSINGLYDGQDALGDGFGEANLLYVSVDGEKAGAYFKIRGQNPTFVKHYGVWFKPADMVKFTVGNHNTVYAFDTAHFGWWTPLGTGADADEGWSVELTPTDAIYFGLHFGASSDLFAADDAAHIPLKACFKFNIDGFGSVGLEAAHGYAIDDEGWNKKSTYNAFALGANISALEAASFDLVGTAYLFDKSKGALPTDEEDEDGNPILLPWEENYGPMFKVEAAVNASVGADIYFLSRTLIRTTEGNNKLGEILFARADYYFDNFSIYGFAGYAMNAAPAGLVGPGGATATDVAFGAVDSTQIWAEIGCPISIDMVTVTPAFNFRSDKIGDAKANNKWSLPIRVSIEY